MAGIMSVYPPETHLGTVTSWVPLTSAFPSSKGCESLYWSVVRSTLAAWDPGYGLSVDRNVHCVPQAVTTWWNQDLLGVNSLTRLSIGPITCPSGYTTGTSEIRDSTSTFVACCPPNYTYVALKDVGNTGECSSIIPANENITYAVRDQSSNWVTAVTSYTTASPVWGIHIDGYNVASQTSSSSSSSPSTSSTSTKSLSSPTDSPSPAEQGSGAQSSSGLSTGAKAGIGIGVALVAIAVGALIFWILARRRHAAAADYSVAETQGSPAPVYTDTPKVGSHATYEMSNRGEMGGAGQTTYSELDGRGVPAEMQATRY